VNSHFFRLAGVRQGGILSPFLFAVFIDSVVGCHYFSVCVSVFLHADNILLIAPSVSVLQILLAACDEELTRLGMQVNEKSRYARGRPLTKYTPRYLHWDEHCNEHKWHARTGRSSKGQRWFKCPHKSKSLPEILQRRSDFWDFDR